MNGDHTFLRTELAIIARLWHIPVNAFTAANVFTLGKAGGPKIASAAVSARAIAARAALRTLDTWQSWCDRLEHTAMSEGPLAPALTGRHWPQCWDTRPIAYFLRESCDPERLAAQGFMRASRGLRIFYDEFKLHNDSKLERARQIPHLQAKLYEFLLREVYPSDTIELYGRRIRDVGFAPPGAGAIERSLKFARRLRPAIAWSWHATMAGAWLTGRRLHDAVIPKCVFGCAEAEDDIRHYVHCQRLWVGVALAALPRMENPMQRFGLLEPGATFLQFQAVAARIAVARGAHLAARLDPPLAESARRASLGQATLHRHGVELRRVFLAGAHQYSCAPGERFGASAIMPRHASASSSAAR